MAIDFGYIQQAITNPALIADIFTVSFSVLILINNFNRGFISILLKLIVSYLAALLILPNVIGVVVTQASLSVAFWVAIVVYGLSLFVLFSIINRLTSNTAYSIVDSILGLVSGVGEIFLVLFVVSACESYLEQTQDVVIPTWIQQGTDSNITGFLLGIVRPYSKKFLSTICDQNKFRKGQKAITDHLGITHYIPTLA